MIHNKKAIVAMLFALAFSFVALPSSAFHSPDIPLVESIPIETSSYAAVRVVVPAGGGDVSIEIEGTRGDDATMSSLGVWSLNADGSPRFGFVFSSFSTSAEELIHVGLPPVGTVVDEKGGGAGGFTGVAVTSNDLAPGEHVFLAIGTADSDVLDGAVNVYASPGTSYSSSVGDAFLLREQDFDGVNVVVKQQSTPLGTPTWVKAIEQASAEVEVEGTLYGLFQGFSNGAPNGEGRLSMALEGPGVSWSGNCAGGGLCAALTFINGGAPGTYDFQIPENIETYDGSQPFPPVVWAMGADVALP